MTALDEPEVEQRRDRGGTVRRALRGLGSVLIVAGLLLLLDAGLTVFWQEPLSALYAKIEQGKLEDRLDDAYPATPAERRALAALPDDSRRIAFAARSLDRKAKPGQPIGRIRIPRIDVSKIIVEGTGGGDLKKGPGHYPRTAMPGAPGTVGIAGHRTTYGAPFRNVDDLEPGDRIVMEMPYAKVTYRVERVRIVPPTATWVVARRSFDRLVLTACHPLYSAAKRIVVFARLESAEPAPRLF
jgi:sortase A